MFVGANDCVICFAGGVSPSLGNFAWFPAVGAILTVFAGEVGEVGNVGNVGDSVLLGAILTVFVGTLTVVVLLVGTTVVVVVLLGFSVSAGVNVLPPIGLIGVSFGGVIPNCFHNMLSHELSGQ